jgi:hypothetical protein
MKRVIVVLFAFASLSMACVASAAEVDRPANRTVAMYFHRTERCPTCQKMGSYTEEAIKKGFEKQLKAGTVEFHYVDFQDKKNAAIAKAYKITGPALIIAKVRSNRVKQYKNLKDIWTKVRKKEEFVSYVRENVHTQLK